jgi:NAD(P)-dependent dehydrogenase (short-subunit alcohol dehydrogenase family)
MPVDVLVNNAGVMGRLTSLEDLDTGDAMRTFDTNALGPLRVTRALLPHLTRGARRCVVHISSGMGSISDNTSGGAYAYRMAKAALNMANKSMSVDLAGRGFVCVVMCPGWVRTDMGGDGAPLSVEGSVRNLVARIDAFGPSDNGTFVSHDGRAFPY